MAKRNEQNETPTSPNVEATSGGYAVGGNDAPEGAEGTTGEATFKLNKTKEIADRFRGDHEVRYTLPRAEPGLTVADALREMHGGNVPDNVRWTLVNIAERFAPEADFALVLVAKINGQGLNLDIQKSIKDYLSDTNEAHKEQTVEEALATAAEAAANFRAGTPRAKGEGKSGKVAKLEAEKAAAVNTALDMYRNLTPELRAQYRPMLISGGMATEEELNTIDA